MQSPRMAKPETNSLVLKVPVSPSLKDKILVAAANERRRNTSEFVRNLIEDALETRQDPHHA